VQRRGRPWRWRGRTGAARPRENFDFEAGEQLNEEDKAILQDAKRPIVVFQSRRNRDREHRRSGSRQLAGCAVLARGRPTWGTRMISDVGQSVAAGGGSAASAPAKGAPDRRTEQTSIKLATIFRIIERRTHLILPSLSYCAMNAQRSLDSFSFLIPAKIILVPGIFALGSLMYSRKVSLFQMIPEFLLASE
jgi:hypothetical protein